MAGFWVFSKMNYICNNYQGVRCGKLETSNSLSKKEITPLRNTKVSGYK